MKTYQIEVTGAPGGVLLKTEPIQGIGSALLATKKLAEAFGPKYVSVTTRTYQREADNFETMSAADFIVTHL
jgi:hypothetical protein